MSLLAKGTVFVRYSPITGKATTGIVQSIFKYGSLDTQTGVVIEKLDVVSTNNVHYPMHECFKVLSFDQQHDWYKEHFIKPLGELQSA